MPEHDTSKMANYGRDTARTYAAFRKAETKLAEEINLALKEGVTPTKVAHDVMGRCAGQNERLNLLSVLIAMVGTDEIPESVIKPFNTGIRPKRL